MLDYMTRVGFKIDIDELNRQAIKSAFDESRPHVEETGLSKAAINDKRTVVARRELVRLFMDKTLGPVATKEQRTYVESIATEALARGDGCFDYLSQFCKTERSTT